MNENANNMGRVAIPADTFLVFTGAMNGCSFVLCSQVGGGGGRIAAHYPNSGGSISGYQKLAALNLVRMKSIDFFKLGTHGQGSYSGLDTNDDPVAAATAQGNAAGWFNTFCFMYKTDAGVWKIMAQPQFCTMSSKGKTKAKRPDGAPEVIVV